MRVPAWLLCLGLLLLAACAEVPPQPASARRVSAHETELAKAIATHRELALRYRQTGELADAAAQWQILLALAPQDEAFRRELAETRAAIGHRSQEHLAAGHAALKSGDADRAAESMLKVLALDPDNAEAREALRDIEKRRAARVQAARAAKVNAAAAAGNGSSHQAASRAPAAEASDAYSYELPLEMLKAGDTAGGLRDLHRFVAANPDAKAARNRIGTAVFDKGKELEGAGSREQALSLYEQAVALRGDPAPGWGARIQALRKSLSNDYFDKGVKAWPADKALAMRQWEASVKFDPQNAKASARLKEARAAEGSAK